MLTLIIPFKVNVSVFSASVPLKAQINGLCRSLGARAGTLEERELRVPGLLLIKCAGGPDA